MKTRIYLLYFCTLLLLPLSTQATENTHMPSLRELKQAVSSEFKTITIINNSQVDDLNNISIYTDKKFSVLLGDLKADITVLNLWASWCPPCINELPSLMALEKTMEGKSLKVLPVSVDLKKNTDELKQFLERNNLEKLTFYHDRDDMLFTALKYQGLPQTYILDSEGNILFNVRGEADWNAPKIVTFLTALLERADGLGLGSLEEPEDTKSHP